jgi:CheY-like chemotaxis protein
MGMALRDHRETFVSESMTSVSDEVRGAFARSGKEPVKNSPMQGNQHRILCVDDDIMGATMRAQILRERGYLVVVYHSPLAVLGCDLSPFDLAILDFHMPGLDGRKLLLRMRALGARFPIVLLTGSLEGLSQEERVLFARCLDKGMPLPRLFEVIAEFLDPNQVPDYGS